MKKKLFLWRSLIIGLLFLLSGEASGESISRALSKDRRQASSETPLVFYADDIKYDRELGVWKAVGHVEFAQEGRILEAHQVIYNEKTNLLTASGDVRLREGSEEVLHAEYAELTGDLKEGFLQQVRYLMADKSRLAAQMAKRSEGGTKTTFTQGVYTPCYPCLKNKESAPVWQIKAREVVQDQTRKTMTATDLHMEFLNVPVFYTPYLRFPTERSSGFLTPTGTLSTTLGTCIGIPYYWAINDISDMTLTPFMMTKQGALLGGQYRHRWQHAQLNLTGSFSGTKTQKMEESADRVDKIPGLRGHFFAKGRVDVNEKWRVLLDGKVVSDKTYFRAFRELSPFSGIWGDPFLQSEIRGERFSQRDYLAMEGVYYQGLREGNSVRRTPIVAPIIAYHQTTQSLWRGSYLTVDTNMTSLARVEGNQYQRAIINGTWNMPHITAAGQIVNAFASLRGDLYRTRVTASLDPKDVLFRGNEGRFFPQAGLECRWPLLNRLAIIEPAVQILGAPSHKYTYKIPDEDSRGFEFNDANVFQRVRFPGFDLLDDGSRVTYGAFLIPQVRVLDSTRLFLGQSYAFSKIQPGLVGTGIYRGFSDFVGHLQADPHPWVSVDGRVRLSRDKLRALFSEASGGLGPEISRFGLTYVHFSRRASIPATIGQQPRVDQLGLSFSSRLNKSWSVELTQLRGLNEIGILSQGVQILYQNECLSVRTFFGRSYYRDRDIRPGSTFLVTIAFKNLGSAGYGGNFQSQNRRLAGGMSGAFSPFSPIG